MTGAPAAIWLSAYELADQPGLPKTPPGVRRLAQREGWRARRRAGRGGGVEYCLDDMPAATQLAVLTHQHSAVDLPADQEGVADRPAATPSALDLDELWARYEALKRPAKQEADRRLDLILEVLKLERSGLTLTAAFQAVAQRAGKSDRTLRRWYYGGKDFVGCRHYAREDWVAALVPTRRGRTATANCSEEAWEFITGLYLRAERPPFTACYEQLMRVAAERGWQVPSYKALLARIRRAVPRQVQILYREGDDALMRTIPAQERDRSHLHALHSVNADGHRFDVMVRWPDGEVGRPVMVAWQDLYSGLMLSWRVDKTENTDAVRLSLCDLVRTYGIPQHAYLDNGRAFASKWMTSGTPTRYRWKVLEDDPDGILRRIGIEAHFVNPYSGQSKPIERAFRDFCDYIAKHPAFAGAYTGNSTSTKPHNYGKRVVDLDEFLRVVEQEVAAHNARPGRRSKVCAGRLSFDAAFNASFAEQPKRMATKNHLRMLMLAVDGVRVRSDASFTLNADRANRYTADFLAQHAGEQLVVHFDPQALHDPVHCYTSEGRYLGEAQCIEAAGFNDSQAARERAREKQRLRKQTRAAGESLNRISALDAARMLPQVQAPPPPDARIVHPIPLRPATELREPVTPTLSDQRLAAAKHSAQVLFMTPAARDPNELPESERYRLWTDLDAQVQAGGVIPAELQAFYENYPKTSYFQTYTEMLRELGTG